MSNISMSNIIFRCMSIILYCLNNILYLSTAWHSAQTPGTHVITGIQHPPLVARPVYLNTFNIIISYIISYINNTRLRGILAILSGGSFKLLGPS